MNSVNYYSSMQKKMGARNPGEFIRLYMVQGMQHCTGGAGTDYFGQNSVPRNDAEHDIDAAVERWVEQGIAPGRIVASKLKNRANPADGVSRMRPLCACPKGAHYTGPAAPTKPRPSTVNSTALLIGSAVTR
jgi:feruloyl esterase